MWSRTCRACACSLAASVVFDLRRLRSAQPFLLERALDGGLRHFEYEIDADSYLRVTPISSNADEFRADVLPVPKTMEHGVAAGTIDTSTPSLFQTMAATGESAELALALAQVFAGEIDFNSEVQPGDSFAVAASERRRLVFRCHARVRSGAGAGVHG